MRETPFVQVDPGILRSNIDAMQSFCDFHGLALRPHAKTHKCLEVADWQLSAGAVGLSVATVGEAEVFAETVAAHGGDLLIAYPVGASADRLRSLAARVPTIVGWILLPGSAGPQQRVCPCRSRSTRVCAAPVSLQPVPPSSRCTRSLSGLMWSACSPFPGTAMPWATAEPRPQQTRRRP